MKSTNARRKKTRDLLLLPKTKQQNH